ncbi:hypothetical protein KXW16_006504 [Aspergillus fumigatus]|nr:hypothetical protein KXW16_006504 [Aspergillus fumigatus]
MADHITPPGSFTLFNVIAKATGQILGLFTLLLPEPTLNCCQPTDKEGSSYDYDPRRSVLTIRMPTPLHEIFCAEVAGEITRQLEAIKQSGNPSTEFAKEIKPFASSRLKLPETTNNGKVEYIIREPDASFGHYKAQYPGVIVEICYSQKSRDIRDLADDYILCTDGSVNAVVCLDIEYRNSKKATVSIWRPKYKFEDGVEVFEASPEVDQKIFRTNDGQPSELDSLRLNLKDFATVELTRSYPNLDSQEIIISSKQLCEFLSRAESRQETEERRNGSTNRIRSGVQKRRRPSTPDSDSQTGEENKRGRYDDSEYHPSSSSDD